MAISSLKSSGNVNSSYVYFPFSLSPTISPKTVYFIVNVLSVIIENLLEATSDRDEKVRNAIYSSLQKVANHYPSEIISSAISYRRRNPKVRYRTIRAIVIVRCARARYLKYPVPLND